MTRQPQTRNAPPRPAWRRLASPLALLALAGLTGCGHPIGSTSDRAGATPKEMAACRQRADEVYSRQNPGAVYRADMLAGGQRDSPFAGSGQPGEPGEGLPARYSRETMLDECLNGLSGSADVPPGDAQPAVTVHP
jgi:hypothetical protein